MSVAIASLDPLVQHQNVHLFGSALIKEDVSVEEMLLACDQRFSFACFHEYVSQQVQRDGVADFSVVSAACSRVYKPGPVTCEHGIGHGIRAYLGEGKLVEALAHCDMLSAHMSTRKACYGGVFMEELHNSMGDPTMGTVFTGDPYKLNCGTLAGLKGETCPFWLPLWWLVAVYHIDANESAYATMGQWCMAYTGVLRNSCFQGIGDAAARDGHGGASEVIERHCLASSRDSADIAQCLFAAASNRGAQVGTHAGKEVCRSLGGKNASLCHLYAERVFSVFHPVVPMAL